jgi:carboxyl-terminal processing protease
MVYRTLGGQHRIVYGGGGITPDIFIGFDTSTLEKNITALYVDGTLSRFIYTYYIQHEDAFAAYANATQFVNGFHDDEKLWNSLAAYAARDTINIRTIPPKDKALMEHHIKALMARQIWRTEGYFEVNNAYDPVVAKALQVVSR